MDRAASSPPAAARAELWRRATALFARAAELPEEERASWLASATGEDLALRRAVEALLRGDRAADSAGFLTAPEAVLAPGTPPAPLPAVIGRYAIRERLGRGGMGEVYRALDPVLKRDVAIKTCLGQDADERAGFAREAETVARLEHPNISRVYDFGVERGVPFLVQELLPGEDLTAWIERRPQPPLARRAAWLLDAARGLAHAHGAGIAHRDVKPGNLRLLPDGTVKVLDFGIARARDAAGGELAGTIAYMAPERLRGPADEFRADVYSWGAVAWEVLAGRRRLRADSPLASLYEAARAETVALREACPECPRDLATLVDRALVSDPARRPADARELVTELAPLVAALAGQPGSGLAEAGRAAEAGRGRPALRPAVAAGLVAVIVAGLLLVAVMRRGERGAIPPPTAAPGPAAGILQIDAQPWAAIEGVVDGAGRAVAVPPGAVTPLALRLPAGEYRVRLRGARGAARECAARLPAAGSARCAAEISAVDVERFLSEALR